MSICTYCFTCDQITYSVESAAEKLGVSEEKVIQRIKDGSLYGYKDNKGDYNIPACGMKQTNQLIYHVLTNQAKLLKEIQQLKQKLLSDKP